MRIERFQHRLGGFEDYYLRNMHPLTLCINLNTGLSGATYFDRRHNQARRQERVGSRLHS